MIRFVCAIALSICYYITFSQTDISTGINGVRIRAGNSNVNFGNNQILLSYNGGTGYSHVIKSRHDGVNLANNSIDFFVWKPDDAVDAPGSNHVMSLNGGRVGIGTTNPSFNLDIATIGDFQGIQLTHNSSGKWTRIFSSLPGGSFNAITATNDAGIIFGNEAGLNAVDNGFVIAPHRSSASGLRISSQGNVGIGTSSPDQKLSINGNISLTNFGHISSNRSASNSYTNLFLGGGIVDQADGTYKVLTDGGSNFFAGIKMDNYGANTGSIKFFSGPTTGGSSYSLTNAALENYTKMIIVNGNVGIGTSSPTSKLTVAGDINGREIKVTIDAGAGPDYVFEKNYLLPSLDSVQSYIDKNKHLPEVPSAKAMEANGVNLGEMNMLLLKKVEELTLYVIELKKENRLEHDNNKKLKNDLDRLIKKVSGIEN